MRKFTREYGFSLVEVIISIAILAVVILASTQFSVVTSKVVDLHQHQVFASRKAMQIINELKTYVETTGEDAAILEIFEDGATTKSELTIQNVNSPTDPPSDNILVNPSSANPNTKYQYSRRINIRRLGDMSTRDIRLVSVKIFLTSKTDADYITLADVWSVIGTSATDPTPPSHVYDLYVIAIENVPGWWVYLNNIIPQTQNIINDIVAHSPGLNFRTHWITKLAYGRDPQYVPYINVAKDSNQTIPWVYFYPDLMPADSATAEYYVANLLKGRARVDFDINNDGLINEKDIINNFNDTDDPANIYDAYYPYLPKNQYPYSLADTYNNAMRYYDELQLWQKRFQAGLEGELTYRLLLDDLYLNPGKYRNALFMNVHGELLPMPPVRNYSDAARDPQSYPYVRVVTHPEKIRYSTTENINLRVYAYLTNPAYTGYPNDRLQTISILIKNPAGAAINPGSITITRIEGGVNPSAFKTYAKGVSPTGDPGGGMWAEKSSTADGVLIKLHNTPLKAPYNDSDSKRGLPSSARLYDLEYIPSPVESASDFSQDLMYASSSAPKNTARWIITIPALNQEALPLQIETRINDDLTTGVLFPPSKKNKPTNISRTYTWITDDINKVPFSEQYQFIGDPRHCPYKDVKVNKGYNWFFTSEVTGYSGYSPVWKGWDISTASDGKGSNNMEVDVPRLFQFLREGLFKTNAVWTTINGYSYYYLGIGNEIGYDSANGFPKSIPVNETPFNDNHTGYEQAITLEGGSYGSGVKIIRHSSGWYGRYWIGELYRDEDYNNWDSTGNMPAPAYYRVAKDSSTMPSAIRFQSARRTQVAGCGSFYNLSNDGSTRFNHVFSDGTGTMSAALKSELESTFNITMLASVASNRPFTLSSSVAGGREWGYAPYTTTRTKGSVIVTLYTHSSGNVASGIIKVYNPSDASKSAYFAVNGLSQTIDLGSTFIARYALMSLVYGFLRAGGDSVTAARIPQLPLVNITYPKETTELEKPETLNITWEKHWQRWSGQPYSSFDTYTATATEPIFYVLLYSIDGGKTWSYIQDGSPAIPGSRPINPAHKINGDVTSYEWDVSQLPAGVYYLRLEAYRENVMLHYSYHQRAFYIER